MIGLEVFNDIKGETTAWRRYLHENPELDYRVYGTAAFVTEKLASFGINHIETGIAEAGVVALIQGQLGDGPTIGFRADMDALPIFETSNTEWASKNAGNMHACGHDGHTAMLLGAAKYLAATRNFTGSVALIFQPAEEDGRGGQRMVQEGIMDRFGISRVFGMHNKPGLDVGKFGICDGPIAAALDEFDIVVRGRGGHAAIPHKTIDPIVIAAHVIVGLQTLVSRNTDPTESLVVSATKLNAGQAYNIVPEYVDIAGTVRTLSSSLRDFAQRQVEACARGIAGAFGADIEFSYRRLEPLTINNTDATNLAIDVARGVVGVPSVDDKIKPSMGSEDFAYMLEARPGAYIWLGNGPTADLHNPAYDFNDAALPYGIGYWVNLAESALAPPR
ncbi:MAG: amidohydrolase [Mesorhizobium sp.]|uniref:M20 aminoacylase family protein n=1 Tax=Mesorhizobium TaxID=68287 RepID=UPI000FE5357E|nr:MULTISPECIES: M20 aminoacylase family protein [Mesorhizobium]MCF6117440.1 M20 family metallopeptidase [Mesorhizobium muleiense]RWE99191.1 MAG: amidohydrolase [Mesorhizobium sp.]RWL14745.1 MAG: amidohydrolase [Mesorhizobium sp.]TIL92973.1 MAG: amidohydrolase [Mesorhizobium sp.]TIM01306.1 MAG: amidohydrolase [Mesorhizobium sp.]